MRTQAQSPAQPDVPNPFSMKRSEARRFLFSTARADPLRAWELGIRYLTAERLSDVSVLLGVIAVELLVTIFLLYQLFAKV